MEFLADGHAVENVLTLTQEEFQRLQELGQLGQIQVQQQYDPLQNPLPQFVDPSLLVSQQQQQPLTPTTTMNNAQNRSSSVKLPEGCLPVDATMTKEDLVSRLRRLAKALQELKQENEEKFSSLAVHLATPAYFNHASKDVRLLVACCMADLFRINAPEAPFQSSELLRDIFLFLTTQLEGLENVNSPLFNRHFYLLENLAWVKSFNICLDLPVDMNQKVFCQLFRLIFRLISEQQAPKIKMFMLDMLCPLILEADHVSTELLAILLTQLLPSSKPQPNRRVASKLAEEIVEKTATALQPFVVKVVHFYIKSKDPLADLPAPMEEEVATLFQRFYDVIYELQQISPEMLLPVLPEFRARLEPPWHNKDRLEATQLLCRLFNLKPDSVDITESSTTAQSSLISQLPELWAALLKKFKDPHALIRSAVIQMTSHVFLNHSRHVDDVVGPLKECGRDVDENIRFHVVQVHVTC